MSDVGMAVRIKFPYTPPRNTRRTIDKRLEESGAAAWLVSRGSCNKEQPEYRVFSVKFLAQQTCVRSIFSKLHNLPVTDDKKENYPDGDVSSPRSDIIIEQCVFRKCSSGNSSPRRDPLDDEDRIHEFLNGESDENQMSTKSSLDSVSGLMKKSFSEIVFCDPLSPTLEYVSIILFFDSITTPSTILVDAAKKLQLKSPISHIWSKDGVVYDVLNTNDVCSNFWTQKDFLYCITVRQSKELRVALSNSLSHVMEVTGMFKENVHELGVKDIDSMKHVDFRAFSSEKRRRFRRSVMFLPILVFLNDRIGRLKKQPC